MKGIFTRLAAVLLAAALAAPAAQAAGTEADPIQVGLAYGSGALVNANLENNTGYGSGYRLGYFDRDLDFVELGRTGSKETSSPWSRPRTPGSAAPPIPIPTMAAR